MLIDTALLSKDEQVYLEMQKLFGDAGYRKFKMRKFEEYSLYLENKSFLGSENVITFNDPSGKLLALKPDVTLSIVKNAKATGKDNEKVYYRENVYRLDKQSGEFKEIDQIGLEFIGEIGLPETLEIVTLALKSLETIDNNFIFAVSHMGYVTAVLETVGLKNNSAKKKVTAFLKKRSAHEIKTFLESEGVDAKSVGRMVKLAECPTEFKAALKVAGECAASADAAEAVDELETLYGAFIGTPYEDKIKLDFSILNDITYYNGIIFQGFAEGFPRMLLSGGRYDKLLEKFKKNVGAMGFALALQELNIYYK